MFTIPRDARFSDAVLISARVITSLGVSPWRHASFWERQLKCGFDTLGSHLRNWFSNCDPSIRTSSVPCHRLCTACHVHLHRWIDRLRHRFCFVDTSIAGQLGKVCGRRLQHYRNRGNLWQYCRRSGSRAQRLNQEGWVDPPQRRFKTNTDPLLDLQHTTTLHTTCSFRPSSCALSRLLLGS